MAENVQMCAIICGTILVLGLVLICAVRSALADGNEVERTAQLKHQLDIARADASQAKWNQIYTGKP